jgi:hypothetical protein
MAVEHLEVGEQEIIGVIEIQEAEEMQEVAVANLDPTSPPHAM